MRLIKGDKVMVTAGKYKGEEGIISKIDSKKNRVYITDLFKAKKHIKPNNENKEGGIIDIETSIDVSNVMIFDPKSRAKKKVLTRIGYRMEKGKKVRFAKKSKKLFKE